MLNKNIISWTREKYTKNLFIFINAWNEWGEGTYLEPDKKYGYASINALSKAIFNLPYMVKSYNSKNFNKKCKIAVQAHIFYEDLIIEVLNKINNIPVKYDLYITTDSEIKKEIIEKNIKKFSNANNYEILILKNKGRDVLPFLIQMHNNIKKYKYICHIHTKKTKFINFGDEWREYLYNNLLGNTYIVSEILSDFDTKSKLGIIFPETFYKVLLNYDTEVTEMDKFYMNYILKKLFKYYKIGKKIEFPVGNMFWAKINSIYQIFELDLKNVFPQERYQVDGTIMHGIERIWVYLVKLNGYYYKKIFKHF
jgi:lipopolysaccharide biosynthesis protein